MKNYIVTLWLIVSYRDSEPETKFAEFSILALSKQDAIRQSYVLHGTGLSVYASECVEA